MRRSVLIFVFALAPVAAEIIDRVAVSLDSGVITESEIRRQIRLTAFLNGEKPEFTPESKRRAADMLVEQFLIRREIATASLQPDNGGVAPEVMAVLKERYPDDAADRRALSEYKLTDEDVKRHLEWQTRLIRFVDVRFRPGVQIPDIEMREHYGNIFVPEWRSRNASPPPPLEEVHDRIENELLSERANAALDRWLGQTRTQTRIRYRQEVFQ